MKKSTDRLIPWGDRSVRIFRNLYPDRYLGIYLQRYVAGCMYVCPGKRSICGTVRTFVPVVVLLVHLQIFFSFRNIVTYKSIDY